MNSRFRSLTNGPKAGEERIEVDLAQLEAELAASIARIGGERAAAAVKPELDTPSRFPTLQPERLAQTPVPKPASAPTSVPKSMTERPPTLEVKPPAGPAGDLLAELKQAAASKDEQDAQQAAQSAAHRAQLDQIMRALLAYLHELCATLDRLQPPVPFAYRPIPGVELTDMAWIQSFVDHRTDGGTEISPLASIALRYTLSAQKQIVVSKLPNHAAAYEEELKRWSLRFRPVERRGAKGMVEQIDFMVEREVSVAVDFKIDVEAEVLHLTTRNFAGLGHARFSAPLATVDRAWMDDFGRYLLGRSEGFLGRLQRLPDAVRWK